MTATSAAKAAIGRWLKLTEGLGLDSAYVESHRGILPANPLCGRCLIHFVRNRTPLEPRPLR